MLSITVTEAWKSAHPGASIGLLEVSGVDNTIASAELEARKREVEAQLREKYKNYTRQDFLSIPAMLAYVQYYKRFSKTYHVLQQVESIALKNKNLPTVSPLVDSNFIAEVDTLALAAGHDVSKLQGSILIDVAQKGDQMTQMNGASKEIYEGDMVMKDEHGICCCTSMGRIIFRLFHPRQLMRCMSCMRLWVFPLNLCKCNCKRLKQIFVCLRLLSL